ncbi:MFS transporter [Mycolicibacterium mengxianglii]|uniref:hypothetical protein n=1 Tax=Mycolicibacterium mengxianglii TaxID=2736649 RepID=UPI0018EED5D5|nr:hypothetical protein [Mycolicibacterium mengxianglii]
MTQPPRAQQKPTRPADVDTGFWLWVAAVPLLAANYIVDVVVAENRSGLAIAISTGFLVVILTLVVTFLVLLRGGYRLARTLLTAGGLASMVSVSFGLFLTGRPTAAAVIFAVTGIVGAVLIGGGIYLLHRKESQAFFTR